jgi:hypothetical protein
MKKTLILQPKLKLFIHLLCKTAKNKGNAELRIDGDFYPCAF